MYEMDTILRSIRYMITGTLDTNKIDVENRITTLEAFAI